MYMCTQIHTHTHTHTHAHTIHVHTDAYTYAMFLPAYLTQGGPPGLILRTKERVEFEALNAHEYQ